MPDFTLAFTTTAITSLIRGSKARLQQLYYGKTPACTAAVRPSRAYEKKSDDKMFEIAYLDPDRLLPVLMQNSVAA